MPTAGGEFGASLAAARFSDTTSGDLPAVTDSVGPTTYQFEPATEPSTKGAGPQTRQPVQESRTTLSSPSKKARTGSAAEAPGIRPASMTTGDYDNNGYADLVVSGTSVGDEPGHGRSYILPGTASVPGRTVRGGDRRLTRRVAGARPARARFTDVPAVSGAPAAFTEGWIRSEPWMSSCRLHAVNAGWTVREFVPNARFYGVVVKALSVSANGVPQLSTRLWLLITVGLAAGALTGKTLTDRVPEKRARLLVLLLALGGGITTLAKGVWAL